MDTTVARSIDRMQGRQRVHLLHIRKTGGTALKHALRQCPKTDHYVIRLHPHEIRLRHIPEGDKVVFFLRDPVARFISGFNGRQRQGEPRYHRVWNAAEKRAFEQFDTPGRLANALSSPDDDERRNAEQAMRGIRHVNSSYWDWFGNEAYFRRRLSDIFFVGFQERLTDDFERLRWKLGISEDVRLPEDDFHAHRNPSTPDHLLDERAEANLRDWYKADYQFIQLCRDTFDI